MKGHTCPCLRSCHCQKAAPPLNYVEFTCFQRLKCRHVSVPVCLHVWVFLVLLVWRCLCVGVTCVSMGPLVFVLIIMAAAAQCKDTAAATGWVMAGPRPRGAAFVTGELYGSVTVAFALYKCKSVWVCVRSCMFRIKLCLPTRFQLGMFSPPPSAQSPFVPPHVGLDPSYWILTSMESDCPEPSFYRWHVKFIQNYDAGLWKHIGWIFLSAPSASFNWLVNHHVSLTNASFIPVNMKRLSLCHAPLSNDCLIHLGCRLKLLWELGKNDGNGRKKLYHWDMIYRRGSDLLMPQKQCFFCNHFSNESSEKI